MTTPDSARSRRGSTFLRTLLVLAALLGGGALGAAVGFKAGDDYGYRRGHSIGFRDGFTENKDARTLPRKEDVRVSLRADVEEMLDGLAAIDGEEVPEAFRTALEHVYAALLAQTARAYPFPSGHEQRALQAWSSVRARVVGEHHAELRRWLSRRSPLPGQRLSLDHHARAVDLHTLLNDRACTELREVWTISATEAQGRPLLPGLCHLVDQELIAPWMAEVEEAALARDVEASVEESRVTHRETIMELATAELRIESTVRHDYVSKLFEGWVIERTDRATLEVQGTGIVKSGFKLDRFYSVTADTSEHVIRVELPRAQILSNTLVPRFSQDKEGWWTSLGATQRNQAIQALQEKVEQQALEEGILEEAEARAAGLVADLYSPLTVLPGSPWTVEVRFSGEPPPEE